MRFAVSTCSLSNELLTIFLVPEPGSLMAGGPIVVPVGLADLEDGTFVFSRRRILLGASPYAGHFASGEVHVSGGGHVDLSPT